VCVCVYRSRVGEHHEAVARRVQANTQANEYVQPGHAVGLGV